MALKEHTDSIQSSKDLILQEFGEQLARVIEKNIYSVVIGKPKSEILDHELTKAYLSSLTKIDDLKTRKFDFISLLAEPTVNAVEILEKLTGGSAKVEEPPLQKSESFVDKLNRSKFIYETQIEKVKKESQHMHKLLQLCRDKFLELSSNHPGKPWLYTSKEDKRGAGLAVYTDQPM